jgi:hypothetical protein
VRIIQKPINKNAEILITKVKKAKTVPIHAMKELGGKKV